MRIETLLWAVVIGAPLFAYVIARAASLAYFKTRREHIDSFINGEHDG